jgi:hypothetical protein
VREQTLPLSRTSQLTAGFLLITIIAIEFGGWYLTNVSRGLVDLTDFQVSFNRAGHAHAGVLVILALVALILADSTRSGGWLFWVSRLAIPAAAVLMPAGFFLSAAGSGRTEPSNWIVLLWFGAASLSIGAAILGLVLLREGFSRAASGVRP